MIIVHVTDTTGKTQGQDMDFEDYNINEALDTALEHMNFPGHTVKIEVRSQFFQVHQEITHVQLRKLRDVYHRMLEQVPAPSLTS